VTHTAGPPHSMHGGHTGTVPKLPYIVQREERKEYEDERRETSAKEWVNQRAIER
jgi:hypothetical protein